ncbi:hypothetical protein GB931_03045 [Modestobacter sp. I12A-02628]|uniref:Condensation domain-containing protein n=1 Tax=Goekera deserti TaxID=2497753 RepID=A0A7K3WCY4_9ACTN|nr:hypothetical protein [Goekera deserti]MPQ96915.1 hypothetical protein [Goekera deserti]NDI46772.1 hypothetical protein [Goekera deserti]NEL54341.1 hypothetical protein [Goekera deserti]
MTVQATYRLRTRALLITGVIDEDRLLQSAAEVLSALPVPGPGILVTAGRPPNDAGHATGASGAADRRRAAGRTLAAGTGDPCVQAVRLSPDELVLAVSVDPRWLDARSVYLVLGAVMQAYFGRFRPTDYPSFERLSRDGRLPAGTPAPTRLSAWQRRLDRWPAGPCPGEGAGPRATARLTIGPDRWIRLNQVTHHSGNTGSIAVIALLSWWFRVRAPRPRTPVYASTLDLREYLGLGTAIGPLTDRIVFDVDESGLSGMTFAELVARTHAGLLDAVVRYVPFSRLPQPVLSPGGRVPWDVVVHYCRSPPSSARTRGEDSLATRGMSIELFDEANLAAADLGHDPTASLELDVTEDAEGIAILMDADCRVLSAEQLQELAADLDTMSGAVAHDPDIPMTRLARR